MAPQPQDQVGVMREVVSVLIYVSKVKKIKKFGIFEKLLIFALVITM